MVLFFSTCNICVPPFENMTCSSEPLKVSISGKTIPGWNERRAPLWSLVYTAVFVQNRVGVWLDTEQIPQILESLHKRVNMIKVILFLFSFWSTGVFFCCCCIFGTNASVFDFLLDFIASWPEVFVVVFCLPGYGQVPMFGTNFAPSQPRTSNAGLSYVLWDCSIKLYKYIYIYT